MLIPYWDWPTLKIWAQSDLCLRLCKLFAVLVLLQCDYTENLSLIKFWLWAELSWAGLGSAWLSWIPHCTYVQLSNWDEIIQKIQRRLSFGEVFVININFFRMNAFSATSTFDMMTSLSQLASYHLSFIAKSYFPWKWSYIFNQNKLLFFNNL